MWSAIGVNHVNFKELESGGNDLDHWCIVDVASHNPYVCVVNTTYLLEAESVNSASHINVLIKINAVGCTFKDPWP